MGERPRKKAKKRHRNRSHRESSDGEPQPRIGRPRNSGSNEPRDENDLSIDLGFLTGPLLEMPRIDGVEPEFFQQPRWGIEPWDWDEEQEDGVPAR